MTNDEPSCLDRIERMIEALKAFKISLWLSYDAEADTACINFQNPPAEADNSELTDKDVLLRYSEDGEVIGLTILHVSQR